MWNKSIRESTLTSSPRTQHILSRGCAFPTLCLRRNDAFKLSTMSLAISLNLFYACSFSRVAISTIGTLSRLSDREQQELLSICRCNASSCARLCFSLLLTNCAFYSLLSCDRSHVIILIRDGP